MRVSPAIWHALRIVSVATVITLCIGLVAYPEVTLSVFWGLVIPFLPLLFFIAPGLWRNLCPVAALNQAPRVFSFSRALKPPKWLGKYGYLLGVSLYLTIVPTRKVLFNEEGLALALLILAVLMAAFIGGVVFKGKSGWCSSICPMLPVQRLYGQTPFITVRNTHCNPCLGCTKNSYDYDPTVAYLTDLYQKDRDVAKYRKGFAGALPGVILAFYMIPTPPAIPILEMYFQFALAILASLGSFLLLDFFIKVTRNKLTALYAASALNLFYWFNIPMLVNKLDEPSGVSEVEWLTWGTRMAIFALTAVWLVRTWKVEQFYLTQIQKRGKG